MPRLLWLPIIGLILIGIGITFLVLTLAAPTTPLISPILGVFCQADETLQVTKTSNSASTRATSNVYYCEATDGTRRDVNNQVGGIIFGGFGITFGLGMFLFYRFAMLLIKKYVNPYQNQRNRVDTS